MLCNVIAVSMIVLSEVLPTQACQELENLNSLEKVTYQEWLLWRDFYTILFPIAHIFKNEIINNNKTLSWLIRKLAERNTKLAYRERIKQ